MKKINSLDFIIRAKEIHGDKYDYSLVEYNNAKSKVKIKCLIHGVFEQLPDNHISKCQGCPICYGNKKSTTYNFIEKSKIIHNNKYDYKLVEYKNNRIKVKIICQEHGVFEQTPYHHLNRNQGCPKCLSKNKTNESVVKDFYNVHGDEYDYSCVEYINNEKKLKINCKKHGYFYQSYIKHCLQKHGCPICKESIGEKFIRKYLKGNNIIFNTQHRFDGCKNKYKLPFDFYLPELNMCIEYDGIQHFEPVEHFGGDKVFRDTIKRDNIKTKYCNNNNIQLIRIRYDENCEDKLKTIFS